MYVFEGRAMGNVIPEVKAAADVEIGSNDEDGTTQWLSRKWGRTVMKNNGKGSLWQS